MNENIRMDKNKSLLNAFLAYYKPHVKLFVADTICALGLAAVDLAFPQILRGLTTGVFTQGPDAIHAAMPYIAVGLIGIYAFRYFCRWFVTSWGHIMGVRMETQMRQDLFDAYERFSFSYFDHHNTGDLLSRVTNDLFDIAECAHHGPEWIIICSIEIIGSFVILASISWRLSAALAVATLVLFIYGLWANGRLTELFRDNRRKIAQVNAQLEDSLAGARVVKSFANEEVESTKFARSNEAYQASKVRNYLGMGRFNASVSGFTGVLYAIIVIYGGLLVADGQLQGVPHEPGHAARQEEPDHLQGIPDAVGPLVEDAGQGVETGDQHEPEEEVGKQDQQDDPEHQLRGEASFIAVHLRPPPWLRRP